MLWCGTGCRFFSEFHSPDGVVGRSDLATVMTLDDVEINGSVEAPNTNAPIVEIVLNVVNLVGRQVLGTDAASRCSPASCRTRNVRLGP